MTQKTRHFYEFGPFRLDSDGGVLMKDGEVVSLKPKAVDMLVVLIENRGQVVSKEVLMERLWPNTFVDESNLSNYIHLLRKELGAEFIKTISKRGYRIVGDVREVEVEPSSAMVVTTAVEERSSPATQQEDAPVPASPAPEPVVEDRLTTLRHLIRRSGIGLAVLVAAVFSAVWGFLQRSHSADPFVHYIPAETRSYYDAYGGRIAPDGNHPIPCSCAVIWQAIHLCARSCQRRRGNADR